MATLVATQKSLVDALEAVLELDSDAVEAYRAAIERLDDDGDRRTLAGFLADHERHVRELSPLVRDFGRTPPRGPDMRKWLAKGKVVIVGLGGDRAVLVAMKGNEEDSSKAYERATGRDDLTPAVREVLVRGLADERRHRAWLERRLGLGQATPARSPG